MIHVLMRKCILASPPPQCWLLTRFARPRRVRMVFGAKGERVRVSAASPLVLAVMRRRAPELQICDTGAEAGSTRCSTRASERCAMFDSWQIMSIWNMRCAQSQQRASHVSTTTRVCGLGAPDIASCSCHKFEKLQRETRIVRGFVARPKCSQKLQNKFGGGCAFPTCTLVHQKVEQPVRPLCRVYFFYIKIF